MLTYPQAIHRLFANYTNFNGRACRSEYWWFVFTNFIHSIFVTAVALILAKYIMNSPVYALGELPIMILVSICLLWIYSGVYSLVVFIPSLSLTVRRLHDIGKNGWWMLISLIPIFGWMFMLLFMISASDDHPNRYGNQPAPFAGKCNTIPLGVFFSSMLVVSIVVSSAVLAGGKNSSNIPVSDTLQVEDTAILDSSYVVDSVETEKPKHHRHHDDDYYGDPYYYYDGYGDYDDYWGAADTAAYY